MAILGFLGVTIATGHHCVLVDYPNDWEVREVAAPHHLVGLSFVTVCLLSLTRL